VPFSELVACDANVKAVAVVSPHDGTVKQFITCAQANAALERSGHGANIEREPEAMSRRDEREAAAQLLFDGLEPALKVAFDDEAWPKIRHVVLSEVLASRRTVDDLRLMLLHWFDSMDWYGFGDLSEYFEIAREFEAAEETAEEAGDNDFDQRAWFHERLKSASADEMSSLLVAAAVGDALGTDALNMRWMGDGTIEAARLRVETAAQFGVDVLDFVERTAQPQDEPAIKPDTPSTAARASKGAKVKGKKSTEEVAPTTAGALDDQAVEAAGTSKKTRMWKAGSAGKKAKDEPADAGVERDPNTSDMFSQEAQS
jgi:hypothetical protein